MLDMEIDQTTQDELEKEACDQVSGFKQELEEGTLCQDLNQHIDDYPNKYYNYKPVKIERIDSYPPQPSRSPDEIFASIS